MKRIKKIACILMIYTVLVPIFSFASENITLLLVPREDQSVRLGMDIGARFPTLLLSYRILPGGAVSLHGWSGTEWVNVTTESYQNGTFFPKAPSSAIVVCKDDEQIPPVLVPSQEWCPAAYQISTTDIRPLLHLLGRQYDFKYDDWKWFVQNYKLPMNSINPDGLNIHWYHQRLSDNLSTGTVSGDSDLHFLSVIFTGQPAIQGEPQVTEHESTEDAAAMPSETGSADNPLTNEVPSAVILGAGDAAETGPEDAAQPVDARSLPEENE